MYIKTINSMKIFLGGDCIIPVCRGEVLPRPAGADLTLRLHVKIKGLIIWRFQLKISKNFNSVKIKNESQ